MDWTNSGELLAVAGKVKEIAVKSNHTIRYINVLHFYNDAGLLIYKVRIPCETVRRQKSLKKIHSWLHLEHSVPVGHKRAKKLSELLVHMDFHI